MRTRKAKTIKLANAKQVIAQCESLFTRYCAGELRDDQARVAGYLLQIASAVIRTCSLEQRMQELATKVAIIESKQPVSRV
ncbi:MAG: hypothetical protein NTV22_05700 [bacterium]|nr:hypothetical protein [bacterium]